MRRKKSNISKKSEARLEKIFLRLMPELPDFLQTLEVEAKRFDGSEPKTFLMNIENRSNRFVEKIVTRERRLHRVFLFLLTKLAAGVWAKKFSVDIIVMTKRLAASDRRYSLLLKLMHEVDGRVPFASIVVSQYYADPRAFFVSRSVVMNSLNRAAEASGEARAHLTLDAFGKTVELIYKPYVNIIWALSYFRLGKLPPSEAPALGVMLGVAHERLSGFTGLLDPDAVWIRNSAIHDPPDSNLQVSSVRLRDRSGTIREFLVEDLLARAQSMYLLSGQTIQLVAQLYLFREVFVQSGLLGLIIDCLRFEVAGDALKLREAEGKAKAHAESMIEPLQRFLEGK